MTVTEPSEQNIKSFKWLNATQFFGALNDNIFKLLIALFLIRQQGDDQAVMIQSVAMGIFVLPFLIFATTSGFLADRFSKSRILLSVKCAELPIMLLGCLGFLLGQGWFLYVVLFLMALQSTVFGPSKYGIIHELVGKQRLSKANGYVEAFTYLAIILGTAAGPLLIKWSGHRFVLAGSACVVVAVLGIISASLIAYTRPAPSSGAAWSPRFIRDAFRTLGSVKEDRELMLGVLASAYFLGIGATLQASIIPYGIEVLGWTETNSALLFLLPAVGIGLGSVLAGWLSGDNIEFGVLPVSASMLSVCALLLAVLPPVLWLVFPLIFLLGISVGLFIIPVKAFIQFRAPKERLGRVLAATSFLSWLAVLVSALLLMLFSKTIDITARQIFVGIGVMTLVLAVVALRAVPDFLLRFIGFLIRKLCYKMRIKGLEHFPIEGPALIISNHVTYVDSLIIGSLRPRRVRFFMNREMYEASGFFKRMFDLSGVIPISPKDGPRQTLAAIDEARRALDEGFLVCIFAEGALTRTGLPRAFSKGFERVLKGRDYPIIPIFLGGLWGSVFSYYEGRIRLKRPREFPYPVNVVIGEPMPPDSKAFSVRQRILELSCESFDMQKPHRRSTFLTFLASARDNWGKLAMNDSLGRELTYGRALIAAFAFGRLLKRETPGEERVGILMPASVGGALVNLALCAIGKVSVNLNFTASKEAFQSALDQSQIKTIVTSRAFLEKLGWEPPPGRILYLEDVLPTLGKTDKLTGLLKARLLPARWAVPQRSFDADNVLTIIFSSGSTGIPKGVELTHHNIMSNIDSLRMLFRFKEQANICCILPFFHSFGYTGTIWFPLLCGYSASYHPNPADGAGVADVVRTNKSWLLITTPTFLLAYIRRAKPEDFASLKLVVTGAEKLKPRIADAFEEKFGIRPLEGYGATELSPVAALNLPDVEIRGLVQKASREGSVGHPIPGVVMKVVDPDSLNELPLGEEGLLLVKGPNVMRGYLGQPEKTAEVITDGWYNTGDIAKLDEDGFVTITDRLSRFSKIGGEMVPHLAVEDAFYQGLSTSELVLAVTSVPDKKKGERLVVLFTKEAGSDRDLKKIIKQADLPNLWKPGSGAYVQVEEIPLLGSGKLDLKALKKMAEELAG